MQKYYLPIKTTSLADYIQRAIILPTRFYDNRPSDIQSLFGDYLFLSTVPFVNDSSCAIELILTDDEVEKLIKQNDVVLSNKPIPISRIRHILFNNNEERLLTVGQINRGTGFINEQIVKISTEEVQSISNTTVIDTDNFKYSEELVTKIKDFEKKLGGIAFVRFNTNNKYSKNYFSILSFFNKFIKEEYEKNSGLKINNSYDGAFSCDGAWKNLASLIYEPILKESVIASAKKENINITTDIADNFEFSKIDYQTETYKLAILNIYGSGSTTRKSIDDLVSSLINGKIEYSKHEGISLIFGINNGYSTFYSEYKEKTVKFKMDSILDYYTIESIFQYVINNNHNSYRFKYLDNIISKKPSVDNLYFETFSMLDETVITGSPTVMSDTKDSVESGMFASALFERFKIFIDNILKKKHEVEALLHHKEEENNKLKVTEVKMTQNIEELTILSQNTEAKLKEEHQKLKEQQEKNSELLQQDIKTKNQIEELNRQLQNIHLQLNEKEEENMELSSKVMNLDQSIKDKEFKLQEEQKKSQEQEIKNSKLFEENINLKNQIARLNDTVKEKEAQLEKIQNEVKDLNKKVTNLGKNINEIKTDNNYKESQLQVKQSDLLNQINNLENKLEILSKEIIEVNGQLQEKQEKNNELEASLEKARGIYREQISEIKRLKKIDEAPPQNKINLNGMRKQELLELAKQKGIKVSNKNTVQELRDIISSGNSLL